jgi:hypothetical protein
MLQQNSENSKPVSTERAYTLELSPESISKARKMVTGSAMARLWVAPERGFSQSR